MGSGGEQGTHVSEGLQDDGDHGLPVVLVHALFAEDVHDDLDAEVERLAQPSIMREQRGGMPEVDCARPDGAQKCGDDAQEYVLPLQFRARHLCCNA